MEIENKVGVAQMPKKEDFKFKYMEVVREFNGTLIVSIPKKFIPDDIKIEKGDKIFATIETARFD